VATVEHAARLAEEGAAGAESEERVSPLELFFDLVFVFAITQVTAFVPTTRRGRESPAAC